jgi:hypothetical protein
VLVALAACEDARDKLAEAAAEKAIEKVLEAKTGEDLSIDRSKDGLVVRSARGGEMRLGGQAGEVPEGWPSDVPAYPGAKILMSLKLEKGWTLSLETAASLDEVVQYYKQQLASMEQKAAVDLAKSKTLILSCGGKHVTVAVNQDEKRKLTLINLIVGVDEPPAPAPR